MRYPVRALVCGILGLVILAAVLPSSADPPSAITISVDASADRHAISPLIYGIGDYEPSYSVTSLVDLGATLNRNDATPASTYNWQLNAANRAIDFFWESIARPDPTPGELGDSTIQVSKDAGAQAMLAIPMLDWVAKVTDPGRDRLCSFSIAKYGPQTDADGDCGNGILQVDGSLITAVQSDAYVRSGVDVLPPPGMGSVTQRDWIQHLVNKWGTAANGGLRYYLMDNEPSIWWEQHRDVAPTGAHDTDIVDKIRLYADAVKAIDATALVVGPEEWGWSGYFFSGYDQQRFDTVDCCTDHDAPNFHGDYLPYLLDQLHQHQIDTGQRLLDVFSVHYYPQGDLLGHQEFSDDTDSATQLLRNKSTRSLWDPSYVDVSWINDTVRLIPRLKELVATHYPGTLSALTEYNWGAEGHINGGTAQADILGILGREGIDMAVRWQMPAPGSPAYNAIKMYRNYDAGHSTFGETSVRASVVNANLDDVAAFAALRASDGALTIMVVGKFLATQVTSTQATINLANFGGQTAQVYQLTANPNAITRLADIPVSGSALVATIPAQSITLFVVAPSSGPGGGAPPSLTLALNGTTFGHGNTLVLTGTLTPGSTPTTVDAYVVLRVPGGSFLSLTPSGGVVPGIVPIATGITPFAFTGVLLQYGVTGGEPQGAYAFLAGLTQAGTLNVIGSLDEKDFTIGP